MTNPYWGKDFFGFFALAAKRAVLAFSGNLSLGDLAPDEIQMLVLVLAAAATALVGAFLVLKKMTMLANSLSHTILLGVILAYLIFLFSATNPQEMVSEGVLLIASLITGLLTTFLTQFLHQTMKVTQDASIGLVFTTLFALGLVIVTVYTRNAHIGIEAVMGNVDALHLHDLRLVGMTFLLNVVVIALFFKELQLTAFDPLFSRSIGVSTGGFNYLLMVLVSAAAIASFRAIGVLLFLAFLVGPVVVARCFAQRLLPLILLAMAVGCACAVCGVALSRHFFTVYHLPLSTAGLTVAMMGLIVTGVLIAKTLRRPVQY